MAENGGHLASNLGIVELSIAIHSIFNTPEDKIIWDVGHQSYIHKMLTGRQGDFPSLRQFGGMAGFPKPSESDSDAFAVSHCELVNCIVNNLLESQSWNCTSIYTSPGQFRVDDHDC